MNAALPEAPARVPVLGFFEITDECNLRCVHCWSASGERSRDELSTTEALDVVSQLATSGFRSVRLTGGEPFLREDWPKIARRASSLGMEVSIITNGTLVDERRVEAMVESGVSNLRVSVDGDRNVHDAVRVPADRASGSVWDKAMGALGLAAKAGLKATAITQIHRRNLESLDSIHDAVAAAGAAEWQVQIAMPMGRMLELRYEYLIEPDDLTFIEQTLASLAQRRVLKVAVTCNIGYYGKLEPKLRVSKDGRPVFFTGCEAGNRLLAVRSNGEVKGCPSHPRSFVVGNLREERLDAIWSDPSRFAYNTAFAFENLVGGCAECSFKRVCRAGCRSMAFAVTGTIYDNPFCLQRVGKKGAR